MSPRRQKLIIRAGINLDQLGFQQAIKLGKCEGDLPARHKWNSEERPYCVPNEFICGELGRFIGLPIPPFAITQAPAFKQQQIFSSLNFNFGGRNLRPVSPAKCVACLPGLCAGIVVFDIFVANSDRHDENLAVDSYQRPSAIQVFDHDVALFGYLRNENRLAAVAGRLAISAGVVTLGNRHVLLDELKTTADMGPWLDRIHSIPQGFVERICLESVPLGLTHDEATAAIRFLTTRQWEIRGTINRHLDEFRGLAKRETV